MSLSFNELEALCRKAARGAGFDWGPADDAGRAVRHLAAFGLPGAELLAARLALLDGSGLTPRAFAPRSLDGEWRGEGRALCPILAGGALGDTAWRLGDAGELVLHDVLSPLLLVPFAALTARRLGAPVSVGWRDVVLTDDGDTLRLDGARRRTLDERADLVRCRVAAAPGTAAGGNPVTNTSGTGTPIGDVPVGGVLHRAERARPDAAYVERLEAFAHRTYAPATERSRRLGAGGASGEDD